MCLKIYKMNEDLEFYYKVIEANPNNPHAYRGLGLAKCKLKYYYSAIKDFSKSIELNNINNIDVYFYRALAKFKSYDYDGAITDFSKLIELNPNEGYFFNNIKKNKIQGKFETFKDIETVMYVTDKNLIQLFIKECYDKIGTNIKNKKWN